MIQQLFTWLYKYSFDQRDQDSSWMGQRWDMNALEVTEIRWIVCTDYFFVLSEIMLKPLSVEVSMQNLDESVIKTSLKLTSICVKY